MVLAQSINVYSQIGAILVLFRYYADTTPVLYVCHNYFNTVSNEYYFGTIMLYWKGQTLLVKGNLWGWVEIQEVLQQLLSKIKKTTRRQVEYMNNIEF